MKDKILSLRGEGKSYREIEKILGCSRGLISYYINPDGKTKTLDRQNKNRFIRRSKYKKLLGGKCEKCGYNKCLDALQFHHKDPSQKDFMVSDFIWGRNNITEERALEEIKKCSLLCANCHAELHSITYNQ
jgi:hypothetical protein